jgi:hypothetical protein
MQRMTRTTVAAMALLSCSALPLAAQSAGRKGLSVGLTMAAGEYADHFARFPNEIDAVRVFSSGGPPPWTDSRIQQLKAQGIVPFISHKSYDPAAFRTWLLAMPADLPMVYLAHCHECEADLSAETYIAHQRAYWDVVQALPASIRQRVKYGPIQTKQWTENDGRSYATYDPGIGDFWGVDAYVNTWGLAYPDAATWLARIRQYDTGGRRKWLPELGVICMPSDTDDSARAAWIDSVAKILQADRSFQLVLWWATMGTAGGEVDGVGTVRNFRLNEKYTTAGGTVPVTPSVKAWKRFMRRNGTP